MTETHRPSNFTPRRAAAASLIGTTIEWYDYYIFGTATVLVLNSQYFPNLSPYTATLASFATFSVAFVARPVGGIIFGHFGDRIGRKKMLVLSILTMGFGTLMVGVLPTYASVGIMAPVLLVVCRVLQGVAVGGEWGGAVLMALEHAPPKKRSFYASWPQCGVPAGTVLSAGAFGLVQLLPTDEFLSWGWRVPFFASAVLVAVGLYIRLAITESPDFIEVKQRGEQARVPAWDIVRFHRKALVIGMFCLTAPNAFFYLATVFMLRYGPNVLHVDRGTIFVSLMVAAAIQLVSMPYLSTFADRTDRRTILLLACGVAAVAAFPVFWLFNTGTTWGVLLSLVVALPIVHGVSYGVSSSFIAELFPARVRFSGSALAYQLGAVVTSAPVPFLATALFAQYGSTTAVSVYVIVAAAVGAAFITWAPRRPAVDTHPSGTHPSGADSLRNAANS